MYKSIIFVLIGVFLLIYNSGVAAQADSGNKEPITITVCGDLSLNQMPFIFPASDVKISKWGHGLDYFYYESSNFKFRNLVYTQELVNGIYVGVGVGDTHYYNFEQVGTNITTTEYSENPFIFCVGREDRMGWFTSKAEIGYMIASVKSFIGPNEKYPQNRFYSTLGIGLNIDI